MINGNAMELAGTQLVDKSQLVRLLDVFLLGPFLIRYAGKWGKGVSRDFLLVSGIFTILYNGNNYLLNSEQ